MSLYRVVELEGLKIDRRVKLGLGLNASEVRRGMLSAFA